MIVKLAVGELVAYVFLVYLNRYMNKHIYESIASIARDACVIVMGDFNLHVGFLGEQTKNYGGEMLLEFAERWGLAILNCDSRCKGVYTRSVRNGKTEKVSLSI